MPRLLLVSFIALFLGASGTEDDAKKIQGTWIVVKTEKDGKDDGGQGNKLVFKDNMLTIDDGKKDGKSEKFKLDATKKPKEIDLPFGPAIYELDGDNLKLCWTNSKGRPTKFSGGADCCLVELKRNKK